MATKKAWNFKGVLQNDPCAFCGNPGGTVDHIHPRSKGGPNHWLNYTGACNYCNTRKGSRSLLGYLTGVDIEPAIVAPIESEPLPSFFPLHTLLGVNYWDGKPIPPKKIKTLEPKPRITRDISDFHSIEHAAEAGMRYVADRNGLTRVIKLAPKQQYVQPQWVIKELVKRLGL